MMVATDRHGRPITKADMVMETAALLGALGPRIVEQIIVGRGLSHTKLYLD